VVSLSFSLDFRSTIFPEGELYSSTIWCIFFCRRSNWAEDRFEDVTARYESLDHYWNVDHSRDWDEVFGVISTLLVQYTTKELTYATDYLAAFSGIFERVSTQLSCGEFIQGMPSFDLELFLAFLPNRDIDKEPSTLTRREGFPSYSWAGWTSGIHFLFRSASTWIIWYKLDETGSNRVLAPEKRETGLRTDPIVPPLIESCYVDTLETVPSGTINPEPSFPLYTLLQFWTIAARFRVLSPPTSKDKNKNILLDSSGLECGWIGLYPAYEKVADQMVEVILLFECDRRNEKTIRHNDKLAPYCVMAIEWHNGVAERIGIGALSKSLLRRSFSPGPVWKEILLG